MYVFEVSNLTLNKKQEKQYLVVPLENTPTEEKIHYPITMPRLDRVWVSKDIKTYVVEKVLPYVDVWGGQEEYDHYTEIRKDTIYRIWKDGKISALWFNRVEYGTGNAPALVGDATLFISPDGVAISDILTSDVTAIMTTNSIGEVSTASSYPVDSESIIDVD